MMDLSTEIQRVDRDISRISSEREQMQKGLTENTAKTQETINKLAAQIASLQASKQRLQDFMGFDGKLAELAALKAEHLTCTTVINARTGERDAALADASTKAATITTLNSTVATRDATIVFLEGTVDARDLQIEGLNGTVATMQAQIEALLAQLPDNGFDAFDESRTGDNSALGFQEIHVIYEADMFPAGVTEAQRATTAPNMAFLETFFANRRATNPDVDLVCLDLEAWRFGTNTTNTSPPNLTSVAWYEALVLKAREHFPYVGLYGIPERFTNYLNYAPTHTTHIERKNAWFARMSAFQPVFDACTHLFPTFYPVAPLHWKNSSGVLVRDVAKIDLWLDHQAALCATHAPGKKVYPFQAPGNHSSLEMPAGTYMPGDWFYDWLAGIHARFDGYVWWMGTSQEHPTTLNPIPGYWPKLVQIHGEWGLS